MRRPRLFRCARTSLLVLLVVGGQCYSDYSRIARAQQIGAELVTELNLSDFATQGVVSIQHAPGRPNDLFMGILDGRIMRVDLTDNSVSTFATIPDIDQSGATGFFGLQGFTFSPDFATNGQLFVHVADDRNAAAGVHHRNYIRRYDLTNPLSNTPALSPATNLLQADWPRHDHDGGFLGFQPGDNNTLWIANGDGGNNDGNPDPDRTGQDPSDLLGSILRIDVSGDDFPADPNRNYKIPANNPFADGVGGSPEVWSYGVRSPWGGSFDRATGDFVFGDVGQVTREEVNFERAGSPGGRNYGWRVMEGSQPAPFTQEPGDLPPNDPSFTAPIHDYIHTGGYGSGNSQPFTGRSVTGGYVYRGPITQLQGQYIFGDWSSRQVWGMTIDRDANGGLGGLVLGSLVDYSEAFDRPLGAQGNFGSGVTAFGEDEAGNLYFSELNGRLFKICENCGPPPPPPPMPLEPAATLRDEFDQSHDYLAGTVPAAGIWDDVYNEGNGGNGFDANTSNAGQLTMGIDGTGWEGGGRDDGRFLFREVDASTLQEVRVKITQQTAGFWSAAGILVRAAGPLDDNAGNDNFLSAHSFRTSETGNSAVMSNVVAGVEGEAGTDVASASDLTYLRLVNNGNGEFEMFTSSDGTNWISRQVGTNAALASGTLEVGVWGGTFGSLPDATAQFDWAEIRLGVWAGDYNEDGLIDAADYTTWRNALGTAVTPWEGADGDGDGIVTAADYDVWKLNFGKTIQHLDGAGSLAAVPEPNSLVLLLAGIMLGSYGRRRHKRFEVERAAHLPDPFGRAVGRKSGWRNYPRSPNNRCPDDRFS